jgi:hypothetical protein
VIKKPGGQGKPFFAFGKTPISPFEKRGSDLGRSLRLAAFAAQNGPPDRPYAVATNCLLRKTRLTLSTGDMNRPVEGKPFFVFRKRTDLRGR